MLEVVDLGARQLETARFCGSGLIMCRVGQHRILFGGKLLFSNLHLLVFLEKVIPSFALT